MIPGEIIVKIIYINVDGTANFLLSEICAVVEDEERTGNVIVVADDNYPVKLLDVFTTIAEILVGFGDEVDKKLEQDTVYVRFEDINYPSGHISKEDNP